MSYVYTGTRHSKLTKLVHYAFFFITARNQPFDQFVLVVMTIDCNNVLEHLKTIPMLSDQFL